MIEVARGVQSTWTPESMATSAVWHLAKKNSTLRSLSSSTLNRSLLKTQMAQTSELQSVCTSACCSWRFATWLTGVGTPAQHCIAKEPTKKHVPAPFQIQRAPQVGSSRDLVQVFILKWDEVLSCLIQDARLLIARQRDFRCYFSCCRMLQANAFARTQSYTIVRKQTHKHWWNSGLVLNWIIECANSFFRVQQVILT